MLGAMPSPKTVCTILLAPLCICVVAWILIAIFVRPSNDHDWSADQASLSHADIQGDVVTISNVRNSVYRSTTDYDLKLETRTYNLSTIKRAWYVVEPFTGFKGSAHTFVTFEFQGPQNTPEYVGVSIEIRKEKGEKFSAWKGILRQYELMYVVGDERDLIKLRSNFRKDNVYLFPMSLNPAETRVLFVTMMDRVNTLEAKPEFYNTLVNNCTTNIRTDLNAISAANVPFSWRLILPDTSDRFFQVHGLIDANFEEENYRTKYLINEKALKYADDPKFSERIREGIRP